MRSDKRNRAMSQYAGHNGAATVAHVERNLLTAYPTASQELTGKQYGAVMSACNTSYQDGRTSCGAERLDTDAVWIKGVGVLVKQADGTWRNESPEDAHGNIIA